MNLEILHTYIHLRATRLRASVCLTHELSRARVIRHYPRARRWAPVECLFP